MKREDIEKEAMLRFSIEDSTVGVDKFIEGAIWRIETSWHDMDTIPNFSQLPILMKHKSGPIHFIDNTPSVWEYLKKYYINWAYVKDLIPE